MNERSRRWFYRTLVLFGALVSCIPAYFISEKLYFYNSSRLRTLDINENYEAYQMIMKSERLWQDFLQSIVFFIGPSLALMCFLAGCYFLAINNSGELKHRNYVIIMMMLAFVPIVAWLNFAFSPLGLF